MTPRSTLQRAAVAALAVGALTACTSHTTGPTASPTTTNTPTPTPTPLTAAETAQEAVRLWNLKEREDGHRETVCALFTSDALKYPVDEDRDEGEPTEGAVPMSRWCGSSGRQEPIPEPRYEVADSIPSIEEQITGPDGDPWVRLMVGADPGNQYVAALAEDEGTWQVTGWCFFSVRAGLRGPSHPDDPFYCLRGAQP